MYILECSISIFVLSITTSFAAVYPTAGSLQFPTSGYLQSKGNNVFGASNVIENGKWHLGDDINAKASNNIYAMGAGIVRHAAYHSPRLVDGKYYRNYGGMYIIEHNVNGEKVCAL